ncbi:MAG TPA: hypothetical protein VLA88_01655 [Candidatus Saccharimonadales bacterium]|nr:hypothetical protein [Candidatus Saccharimonadales bacterium]
MAEHKNSGKLVSAKYGEWQASLFGACFIAFGLGVLLHRFIGNWAWLIIIVGVFLHSWGMAKTYTRNK